MQTARERAGSGCRLHVRGRGLGADCIIMMSCTTYHISTVMSFVWLHDVIVNNTVCNCIRCYIIAV